MALVLFFKKDSSAVETICTYYLVMELGFPSWPAKVFPSCRMGLRTFRHILLRCSPTCVPVLNGEKRGCISLSVLEGACISLSVLEGFSIRLFALNGVGISLPVPKRVCISLSVLEGVYISLSAPASMYQCVTTGESLYLLVCTSESVSACMSWR